MAESGKDKLLSLLFGGATELVNFKFFPGDEVTSDEDLCMAAHEALMKVDAGDCSEAIPVTKGKPTHFGDLVAAV